MKKEISNKLRAIWAILTHRGVGCLLFNETPTEGDTITINNMVAIFKKIS